MNVHLATSLGDALQFKGAHPSARVLLGGTDLLAQWQAGAARPDEVLALESLPELQRIQHEDAGVTIGAGVSHFAIAHDEVLTRRLPALSLAARSVGAPAIQLMGTLAGNIANASPAADLPPSLLVYDARVLIASERGERQVALEWFYTGYRRLDLGPDELIVGVQVPWPAQGTSSAYLKVGTRAAQSIARVALAGRVSATDGVVSHVRFAAASVAATPVRLTAVEDLVGPAPHGRTRRPGLDRGGRVDLAHRRRPRVGRVPAPRTRRPRRAVPRDRPPAPDLSRAPPPPAGQSVTRLLPFRDTIWCFALRSSGRLSGHLLHSACSCSIADRCSRLSACKVLACEVRPGQLHVRRVATF